MFLKPFHDMALFDWLRGRKTEEGFEKLPWEQHPSIFEYIQAHILPGEKGLSQGGEALPDEERSNKGSQIRWAAGARDGVATHHMGTGDHDQQVAKALDLVATYCAAPSVKNKLEIYNFILEHDVLGWIDPFLEAIADRGGIKHDRLYLLAKSFTTEAPDREPVKFGVSLLGRYREPGDRQILHALGRHDEFTLYCAVALSNMIEGEFGLWQLARHVDGWGRIHCVERLSETENPEIKDWLLREGYKNSVMYEYLAYTCAVTGGLLPALERDRVDDELLNSAAELIRALLNGGPAQSIDDYEDGAAVIGRFVDCMETRAVSLTQLLTIVAIREFLTNEAADWNDRANRGWPSDVRGRIKEQCSAIIDDPEWRQRVLTGLEQSDEQLFGEAYSAAAALKIDAWPHHWKRLQEWPKNSGRWYHVMAGCDRSRLGDALALAERVLPLDSMASGPTDQIGFGLGFEDYNCLDFILQELTRFPGYGSKLIEVGLRSPTIRNRNMALKVLSEWGPQNWPTGIDGFLRTGLAIEPNDDVRKRIENVLAGKPLE